jgi:hypothetical protein
MPGMAHLDGEMIFGNFGNKLNDFALLSLAQIHSAGRCLTYQKNKIMKVVIISLIFLTIFISHSSISQTPYDNEEICMVTFDTALNKNIVLWNKTPNVGTAFFNIYRDSTNLDSYDLIGTVSYNDGGYFIDSTSKPLERWYKYKLSVVDSSGKESSLSQHHKTIFLEVSTGIGVVNLYWNKYEGISFINYYIIARGTNLSNISILDSIQK